MTRDKYSVTSTKDENGTVTHRREGKVNTNANESEPYMHPITSLDSRYQRIKKLHEEHLRRTGDVSITTRVVGKKLGRIPFLRGLKELAYELSD